MTTQRAHMSLEETDQLPEFQAQDDDLLDDDELDDEDRDEDDEREPDDEGTDPDEDHELDLDEIMAVEDTADEKLFIPEWRGYVTIKGVTKREFDFMRQKSRGKNVRTRSERQAVLEQELFLAAVTIKGKNLILPQYNRLLNKNAGVMNRITDRILKKSGLEKEAEKERTARFPQKR
jgi:hypothetical protein